MPNTHKNPDITLEALLELKRCERPDADFWDTFENDFERRRLHALVERNSIFDFLWTPALKAIAFSAPALLLVGLATFWVRHHNAIDTRDIDRSNPVPLQITQGTPDRQDIVETGTEIALASDFEKHASNHFIMDTMESSSRRSMNFRKVLYTPAIKLSIPSGSSYVQDSLGSQNYRVTTAKMQLGRNF